MIGRLVSHYRVLDLLGAGGMGAVYLARDERLARQVALKFVAPAVASDPAARERLLREARTASGLDHPNIATIHEVGEWEGQVFVAMGYYAGETLRQRLHRGALAVAEAAAIAEQIAQGLAAAHAASVVHRDLKPENVIVTTNGLVKLLDFGLAKHVGPLAETELNVTRAGAVTGTVGYMSPEQARGAPVDQRTDIWSFGVVLFEMLTGRLPFDRGTGAATIAAVVADPVPAVRPLRPDVPPPVEHIVERALVKDAAARSLSAADAALALHAWLAPTPMKRRRLSRTARAAIAVAVILAVTAGVVWARRSANRRWAVQTALPRVAALAAAQDFAAAVALAGEAERHAPDHPELQRLWPMIARAVAFESEPPGAEVFYQPYGASESWRRIGVTPTEARLPMGWLEVRAEHVGHDAAEDLAGNFVGHGMTPRVQFSLAPTGSAPPGMVRVAAASTPFSVYVLGLELPGVTLEPFWIDRQEVTNREYRAFVDAGGYTRSELWRHPFVKDGRSLTFAEAMTHFRDATGRPGPAHWETGHYPAGQDDLPVTGVSWHEAAAYAAFAGKQLPTIYHWTWVAAQPLAGAVIPLATFNARSPVRADSTRARHRFGTVNLAGNVKEWTFNQSRQGHRYILGGGFDEPPYMFSDADARSAFERASNFGIRCIKIDGQQPSLARLSAPVEGPRRDYSRERPVSDEIFAAYARLYSYDRTDLAARVEDVDDSHRDWRVERVSFAAAYGRERVLAYVYLPRRVSPPYQTIVLMPPASAWDMRTSAPARANLPFTYLVRAGRAAVFPIYKGTFERGMDDFTSDHSKNTSAWRDHVIALGRDLGRTIDYLATRPDVDPARIGYYGLSRGAALAPIMLAIEPRISAAALWLPGLYLEPVPAEADAINFAPHARAATLVLSGRYDYNFPDETSSLPFFDLLGTPPQHKRRVRYDTGHNLPPHEAVRETLDWFDKYFGAVN